MFTKRITKRTGNVLTALLLSFVFLLSLPVMANANQGPAITSFDVDRATVNPGQAINISVVTTSDVNYVFAVVDGQRVHGTAQGGSIWQIVITPQTSQRLAVVANTANSLTGAAIVNIPIVVNATTTVAPPITTTPSVPTAPATPGQGPTLTLRPQGTPPVSTQPSVVSIQNVVENPGIRANYARITITTSANAEYAWVQFDGNRFRRGQEQISARTADSRTWVVDFRPSRMGEQNVSVFANTAYVVAGAANQNFTLAAEPPAAPAAPTQPAGATPLISGVNPGSRSIAYGTQASISITTNPATTYVWVIDANGNRHNARPTSATAARTIWSVTFNPGRTGQVRIYANTVDSTTGAATRRENFTIQARNATIVSATADATNWSNQGWWGTVRVEVTTNQFAERVWVELPNGERHTLSLHSGSGTSNRVWRADITNQWSSSSWRVYASATSGQFNRDASTSVNITGHHNWSNNLFNHGWANISLTTNPGHRISRGSLSLTHFTGNHASVVISIDTTHDVNALTVNLWGHSYGGHMIQPGFWEVHVHTVPWHNHLSNSISITTTAGAQTSTAQGFFN